MKLFTEPVPWEEAERAFVERGIMTAEEFYKLREELRGFSWTVTRIAQLQQLGRIKDKLERIIAEGGTLEEFRQWVAVQTAETAAWTAAYVQVVFSMAVLTAYNRARWIEFHDPDLGDEFGWFVYDAINDLRTRVQHKALDNQAWRKDEFPDEYWTPNGFNCRCEIRNLNEELLRRSGATIRNGPDDLPTWTDKDGVERTAIPDKGFQVNQARDYGAILAETLEAARMGVMQ